MNSYENGDQICNDSNRTQLEHFYTISWHFAMQACLTKRGPQPLMPKQPHSTSVRQLLYRINLNKIYFNKIYSQDILPNFFYFQQDQMKPFFLFFFSLSYSLFVEKKMKRILSLKQRRYCTTILTKKKNLYYYFFRFYNSVTSIL